MSEEKEVKWFAEKFHETYDFCADIEGWKTNKKCKVPFDKLPKENKQTMLRTCQALLPILEKHFIEAERLRTKKIINEIIGITLGCDSQCYATSKLEKLIEETEPEKEENQKEAVK